MKKIFITIIIAASSYLFCLSPSAAEPSKRSAKEILETYFTLPHFDRQGDERLERVRILDQLKRIPEQAVHEISLVMESIDSPVQRAELAEVLGEMPLLQSAEILISMLDDPDTEFRRNIIQSLRKLSAGVDRCGNTDVAKRPKHPPEIEGLLPHLAKATEDKNSDNRKLALFALVDTRDVKAVEELKKGLTDTDRHIRFTAACLLTEYQVSLGLPELKKRLSELVKRDIKQYDFRDFSDAEHLIASFERITGRNFGKIPILPHFSSSTEGEKRSRRQYAELITKWDDWWARQK